MEEGMTCVSIIKFSCEVKITSIKVADDSVILVGAPRLLDFPSVRAKLKLCYCIETGSLARTIMFHKLDQTVKAGSHGLTSGIMCYLIQYI